MTLTMRIDSISDRADRAGRYLIKLSDGTTLRLYRQTVEDFSLYSGMEINEKNLLCLKEAAGKMSAKMRAVRIVAATNVSKKDLEQRLIRKGESPQQAKETVSWMEGLALLDDEKTARLIVERCAAKGYGLAKAKQSLFEKRIPKDLWEDALADYPDQTENIVNFLRSRLKDNWEERDLKRAIDALLRKGHAYSQIRQGLQCLQMESDDILEEY